MGVKGFSAPQIGGGVSFFACSPYSKRAFICLRLLTRVQLSCPLLLLEFCYSLSISAPWVLRHSKRASKQGKKGQNLIFSCLLLSHLGNFGDNKGQKPNIFLKCGEGERLKICPDCLPFGVPTWCRLAGLQASGPAGVGSGPLVVCSLHFGRFAALLVVDCLQIWLYFAF